jgi:hypothetical protein
METYGVFSNWSVPILVMILAKYNLAAKCIAVISSVPHPKLAEMNLIPF